MIDIMDAGQQACGGITKEAAAAMSSAERIAFINQRRQDCLRGRYTTDELSGLEPEEREKRMQELRDSVTLIAVERTTRGAAKPRGRSKEEVQAADLTDFL